MPQIVKKYLFTSLALILIGTILGLVAKTPPLTNLNYQISSALQQHQPQWFVSFNYAVSLFDFILVFLTLPIFIHFLVQKNYPSALIIFLASFSWALTRFLKLSFGVACPDPSQIQALFPFAEIRDQSSFLPTIIPRLKAYFHLKSCYPSGHVLDYLSVFGTISFLRQEIDRRIIIQKVIYYFSFLLIGLVGISRVSLGAHWLTDIVGGYLFGIAWLFILKSIHHYLSKPRS